MGMIDGASPSKSEVGQGVAVGRCNTCPTTSPLPGGGEVGVAASALLGRVRHPLSRIMSFAASRSGIGEQSRIPAGTGGARPSTDGRLIAPSAGSPSSSGAP